jgi:UDPglucose 6-dehydrogenase
MADIYRPLYLIATPFVWCSLETAELIKYASNAFLATKITFINQMANLAEAAGADIHAIARAMGMDGRISAKFLHPGPGFGGSCFPKDTRALVRMGEQLGVEMSLVRETVRANEEQKLRVVEKLERLTGGTSGKTIAVLGLAFKAETDDIRESPAIAIIEELLRRGAAVRAHDPKATSNFRKLFPEGVRYCSDEFEAAAGADALVLCTEWNEYRNIDLGRLKERMKGRVVVDARNVLDMEKTLREGFVYEGIGRKQFSQG